MSLQTGIIPAICHDNMCCEQNFYDVYNWVSRSGHRFTNSCCLRNTRKRPVTFNDSFYFLFIYFMSSAALGWLVSQQD